MRNTGSLIRLALILGGGVSPAWAAAPVLTTLYTFKGAPNASMANGTLVDLAGTLYGVSLAGGTAGHGTVYKVNATSGAESVVYSFTGGTDGGAPYGALVAHGGLLWGTTSKGGAAGAGTVFTVNPSTGTEKVVHSFGASLDGSTPVAGLLYYNGMFYGTTMLGGAGGLNTGTLFALDPTTQQEHLLHSFNDEFEGVEPMSAVIEANGNLYGTTYSGPSFTGSVYQYDLASNTESTVYTFQNKGDGEQPIGGVIYSNGLLYGTTSCWNGDGGECNGGSFGSAGYGTVFSLNPVTHALVTLHAFTGGADGSYPFSNLIAYHGAVIGSTSGIADEGTTIFAIPVEFTGDVILYTLYDYFPAGLLQKAGALYGATSNRVFKFVP